MFFLRRFEIGLILKIINQKQLKKNNLYIRDALNKFQDFFCTGI